jgi:nucleotide-binding universal stress UspA family protein
MKKVLIAVDDTGASESIFSVFDNLVRPPDEVVLLHVERLEGMSLMIDMLGDAELSTLKESLQGTEYKERLDQRGRNILNFYKKKFESGGLVSVKTVLREGIPSEEIARVAEEEKAELVILGWDGNKGLDRLIMGCLSKDVERTSRVPVIVARNKEEEERACGLGQAKILGTT